MTRRAMAIAGTCLVLMGLAGQASAAIKFRKILYNPPGNDVGTNAHLNKEWVKIKNTGKGNTILEGWKLKDRGGDHTYNFEGVSLPGGDLLVLHSGQGSHRVTSGCGGSCSVHHYYWGLDNYVWNNDGDRAILRKPSGNLADRCTIPGGKKAVKC